MKSIGSYPRETRLDLGSEGRLSELSECRVASADMEECI
jgi:hypothetical protein